MLDFAKVNGFRTGDNPAAWVNNLEHAFPSMGKAEHHAALPYADMFQFMMELRAKESVAARALEFTVLTAARTNEIRGAVWSEFDLTKKVWTIPAEQMKSDREQRVPLSARAVEILKGLPREKDFVFIGVLTGAEIGMNAMLNVLKSLRPGITVHGFRSSIRDWCADCTSYPNDVCEMVLAHAVGSDTEKAYKRSDLFLKRVKLMADWAKYCETPPAEGNVVPIGKTA